MSGIGNAISNNINLYNSMSKIRFKNSKYLQYQHRTLKGDKKTQVDSLIKLYEQGNIHNINTLRYEINKILSLPSNKMTDYIKILIKYSTPSKSQESKLKKQQETEIKLKEQIKTLDLIIKKRKTPEKENLKEYLVEALFFTTSNNNGTRGRQDFKKYGIPYYIYGTRKYRQFEVVSLKFPRNLLKTYITNTEEDKDEWKHILKIMLSDREFKKWYNIVEPYIDAIYIKSVDRIKRNKNKYNALDESLRDTEHISLNYRYIETNLNMSVDTFKDAIQNNNYIKNECWINSLYDFYKDTLLSENNRKHITRQTILNDIGFNEENIKNGVSLNQIKPFFKKYKLKLRVFDIFYKMIYKFDPEMYDNNNKPMYCLIKGNHIYTLNYDLKTLQQKYKDEDDLTIIRANPNYPINENRAIHEYKMIESVNDILNILKTTDNDEKQIINLICKDDKLTEILYEIIDSGYEPSIKYQAGSLTNINLKFNKIIFMIKTQQLVPDSLDGSCSVSCENIYNNMNKAMTIFNSKLFRNEHKSFYTHQDVIILDEYRTIVPNGRLKTIDGNEVAINLVEIDVSKAFSEAFTHIYEIPIFNIFDAYKQFNNQDIKPLNLYIVYARKTNLFLNKTYNLIYGQFLEYFKNDVEILYYKEPSFIKHVDYNNMLKTLFDTHISDDKYEDIYLKKLIAVVNFGLLEKGTNKSQKSYIFESLNEAQHYQAKYGGKISILRKQELKIIEEKDPMDFDFDNYISSITEADVDKKYYILNISDQVDLTNGFRYIKELLLQHHNFKMFSDYNKLKEVGIHAYSVKTDAFTIKKEQIKLAQQTLYFSSNIGGWRLSKTENINIPHTQFTIKDNNKITIEQPKFERININDEWDTNNICNNIIKYKNVMIRAKMPGSGKSYIAQHFTKLGYKVLFVCPTNKLSQQNNGVTINKFFGLTINNDETLNKIDTSQYDVIVFDEIYFNDIHKLLKIKNYVQNNSDKIIIGTGDTSQLEPLTELSNVKKYNKYADECINIIFPYEIYLCENKRLKTNEDKEKLKQIKKDIFNKKINIMTTINKYFKYTTNITQNLKNIAYKNDTCKEVAQHLRKKLNKTSEYEKGEILICREYLKIKSVIFNVNFEYEIIEILNNSLKIKNISSNEIYEVALKLIKSHFNLNYCCTCHSYQGSSINEPITIFDYKFFFVSRKWIWTAITRARNLDDVYFYDYTEDNEFNMNLIKCYFKNKIKGYKEQDRSAKREINKENYINIEWLINSVNKNCYSCCNNLYIDFKDGNTISNITADRINNNDDHNINNIRPCCNWCSIQLYKCIECDNYFDKLIESKHIKNNNPSDKLNHISVEKITETDKLNHISVEKITETDKLNSNYQPTFNNKINYCRCEIDICKCDFPDYELVKCNNNLFCIKCNKWKCRC